MGLGKIIVMGLIGIGCAIELVMTGAYASGHVTTMKGNEGAVAAFIGAVIYALAFLALYLDW